MAGVRKRKGSMLGPKGLKGDGIQNVRRSGDMLLVDEVTRTDSGSSTVTKNLGDVRGPKGDRGDQGLPGTNAVPTAEAIAQNLEIPGPARTALDAIVVPRESGVLGAEVVGNNEFTTNLTGWTGAGWAWAAGTAKHSAGSSAALTQAAAAAIVGTTYAVTLAVTGRTAGGVHVYFGGVSVVPPAGDGTTTSYATATATDAVSIVPTPDFDGAIESISIKPVASDPVRVDAKTRFVKPLVLDAGIEVPAGRHMSMGKDALRASSQGQFNVPSSNMAFGYQAGMKTDVGHVTAFGYRAGENNTNGVLTAFGKWAGMSNTSGHSTMFGNAAGLSNTTGDIDVFGDEAGADNTTGTIAVFGYYAGHTNVTGNVTAFGHEAANAVGPASTSTAVGYQAGQRATGVGATVVGYQAGQVNTTGRLTAVGHEALRSNSLNSTGVGYRAGVSATGDVTLVGYQAGLAVTSGEVVAIGSNAALEMTTGSLLAIGKRAGYGVTTANSPKTDSYGILIGELTNRTVPSATALVEYIGIGYMALVGGHGAVAIGTHANASHADSVALGRSAVTTAANQVMVGNRDLESTRAGGAIFLRSSDGTRYKLSVANGGALAVAPA